jgi:hypothetical protein
MQLKWIDALLADRSINSTAFKVGVFIIQAIGNADSASIHGKDFADKTGGGERQIRRAISDLRSAGWISTKRTREANIYSFNCPPKPKIIKTIRKKNGSTEMGKIYFMRAGDNGAIKIGFTRSPVADRIKGVQTGCSVPIVLMGAMIGTQGDERDLHRKFAKHATSGEWFTPDDELLFYILDLSVSGVLTKDC